MQARLELQAISKTYRSKNTEVRAINELSLSVYPGGLVAIRGQSGCGKSTMLLCAGGLLRPDQGNVIIAGQSFYDLSHTDRRVFRNAKTGFAFQRFHLIPYLSVRENVLLPLKIRGNLNKELIERVDGLIEKLHMHPRMHHLPSALSVGECQRASLARALVSYPDIVFADEPTGNLDDENTECILDVLLQFVKDGGAILLVTHDTRLSNRATRIISMIDGRLTE